LDDIEQFLDREARSLVDGLFDKNERKLLARLLTDENYAKLIAKVFNVDRYEGISATDVPGGEDFVNIMKSLLSNEYDVLWGQLTDDGTHEVYKVKRVNDGKKFQIGDNMPDGVITRMFVADGDLLVCVIQVPDDSEHVILKHIRVIDEKEF
jgi:hypothetical protein